MKINILAVIQARGGSKGIPKKNIYPIGGYPLISYTIAAAKKSKFITDLVVSTDSEEIAEVSRSYGADVPFKRPKKLAGDKVFSVDSLHHAVLETEKIYKKKYDFIIELPCVAPLRDSHDIDGALSMLIEKGSDSVISVVGTGEKHPVRLKKIIKGRIRDMTVEFPEPGQNSRRQDLFPPSYIRNGAIYAMKREVLIEEFSRHGSDSLAFVMDENKSVNIDTVEDLTIADFKINNGECNNNPWEVKQNKIEFFRNKDKKILLVTTPLHFIPKIKEKLKEKYSCIFAAEAKEKDIIDLLKSEKVEAWICSPSPKYKIDKKILNNSKNIKLIITPSTGSNHIDKEYCKKRRITVSSLKDTSFVKEIYASSEYAFSLILSVVRNLPQASRSSLAYKWREVEDNFRGVELRGKNLGIVGFGRIGSNVAKYAIAMGMNVVAYDPQKVIKGKVKQYKSIKQLLNHSDIVLIAVHLDSKTKDMVDKKWFDSMKDGVYFINISRGEIVVEKDLIKALSSGKIKSAGLDVIRNEISNDIKRSKVIDYARNNENLIITPHIAGLTIDSELKAAEFAIKMLFRNLRP